MVDHRCDQCADSELEPFGQPVCWRRASHFQLSPFVAFFFQHVQLEANWLAVAVVKLMKVTPPWVLCVDRTNRKIGRRDVNILMLPVATRHLRIPLMWTVLDKVGSSKD